MALRLTLTLTLTHAHMHVSEARLAQAHEAEHPRSIAQMECPNSLAAESRAFLGHKIRSDDCEQC